MLPKWSDPMKNKRCYSVSLKKLLLVVLPWILIFCAGPIHAADTEHYSEETLISLEFEDKTLNQILKEISWITGYSFVINKEYAELKVSGSLKDVPLHQGLKEIVGKHSHTITYEPNKKIMLNIYESAPPPPLFQNMAELNPSLYTITPQNMDDIQTNTSFETAMREEYQRENLQDEFSDATIEEEYDTEPDSDGRFISKKGNGRRNLKGSNMNTNVQNLVRYNNFQEPSEDEEMEYDMQYEEDQYDE